MTHSEQPRVASLDFFSGDPLRAKKKISVTSGLILPARMRRPQTAPSLFLKYLFFATNYLWGGAPRRLSRPKGSLKQQKSRACAVVNAARPTPRHAEARRVYHVALECADCSRLLSRRCSRTCSVSVVVWLMTAVETIPLKHAYRAVVPV